MFGARYIRSLAQEAGSRARRKNLSPAFFSSIADKDDKSRASFVKKLPNLGNYKPKSFELIEIVLVDRSGFGIPGEPALTIEQFTNSLGLGQCYAIVEEGQFQVNIGIFKKSVHPAFENPVGP